MSASTYIQIHTHIHTQDYGSLLFIFKMPFLNKIVSFTCSVIKIICALQKSYISQP